MTMLPVLNPAYRPILTTADLRFLTIGDGVIGPAQAPPADVERTTKGAAFVKVSSIAQNLTTKALIAATRQADAPFIVGDDRANNWQIAGLPVPAYSGFCERLHWIEAFNAFLGQSAVNSSHSVVLGSPNGMAWNPQLPGTTYRKTHSGFAFSSTLARAVVALQSTGQNILIYDGGNWYPVTLPGGGYSVVWHPEIAAFLAFRAGTQIIKSSADGITWVDYGFFLPVPVGTVAGNFAAYAYPGPSGTRLLIFTSGGTAPAWYSDDDGLNWTACVDMDNTGSVTRYVAVDSNAVYVAFNAELNKGMISMDYGSTWERSDHLSGNALGVIALN